MRVVIIGAGGVGVMAAWRLAKAGHEVIALEQFRLDHDQGSSFGDSRIVRRVYPDPLYTALMAEAYALWEELQAHSPEQTLFQQAGGIFCGPAEHPSVGAAQEALAASRVEYEVLDSAECRRRFPAFALRPEEVAVYEPSMGYARASHCLRVAASLARQYGAQIREADPVTEIKADAAGGTLEVRVQSGQTFRADRLLVTSGAWTGPLLAQFGVFLPLTVTRQPYLHLAPSAGHEADFQEGRFPVWIDIAANAYGFPILGGVPGVKIGMHDRGEATTPKTTERHLRGTDYEAVRVYASERFPWLSPEVVYEKVCLYTSTPDEDFIIDSIPGLPGAYFISACSGHGFKFTPLLGQIAADLLTTGKSGQDLSRFRLSRFA